VKLKYRNKIYNSERIPLFLYFKSSSARKEFANVLLKYEKLNEFKQFNLVHSILAGNTVIKDKRAPIFFSIDTKEERGVLIKGLFIVEDEDSNAMLCTPPDIKEEILQDWIEKYLDKLK